VGETYYLLFICTQFSSIIFAIFKVIFVIYLMLIASITSLKDTITCVFLQFLSNFTVLLDFAKVIQSVVNSSTNSLHDLGFLSDLPMCTEILKMSIFPNLLKNKQTNNNSYSLYSSFALKLSILLFKWESFFFLSHPRTWLLLNFHKACSVWKERLCLKSSLVFLKIIDSTVVFWFFQLLIVIILSGMIYLIYCKNFCKCHNVPPPSTTLKN
jgi:hypothetical protein